MSNYDLLDDPDKRGSDRKDTTDNVGLLQHSITAVVGGPATSFNTLALRYVVKGLEEDIDKPVLVVSFGRDRANFLRRGHRFAWLHKARDAGEDATSKFNKNFHFLYYSPVGLNQNRLFYELRKEIKPDNDKEPVIDRVVIHSVSNLPFAHGDSKATGEFLVPLINLLRELRCTAWITYVSDDSQHILDSPGRFVPSLADNVIVLKNETTKDNRIITKISVLKGHGANILREEQELRITHADEAGTYTSDSLEVMPLQDNGSNTG